MPCSSPPQLCIWDTAGIERFRTMTQGYYRHADGVLLVYSLADSASLRLLTSWAREVDDRTVTSSSPVLKIIVGNKSDLEHRTTEHTASELAATYGCELVLQVSAKTGEGIEEALRVIAGKLLARSRERRRSKLMTSPDSDGNPLTLDRQDRTERRQAPRCC
ncbi:RAB8B [Branchiostoma lanceolatum]|uniref:RAB8B protein n=1 Tax=Branchiostoma lanceolatum TaxID=7740 RepID=A0A8K0A7M4_BRALA|nr:RAB8B [Branchiostoma lanceolatum]